MHDLNERNSLIIFSKNVKLFNKINTRQKNKKLHISSFSKNVLSIII